MSYQATVYNVMVASPGDVPEEREVARQVILDWNNIHAFSRKIILQPVGWEHNSSPAYGDRPQEIINQQLLKDADILIGIFWTRIGTPTGNAASGTVEEIQEHVNLGKPALLYFSNKPTNPNSLYPEQQSAVKALKRQVQQNALTDDFNSVDNFKVKFQRHLSMELNKEKYHTQSSTLQAPNSDKVQEIRHNLSNEAKSMLKMAAQSASGDIMKVSYVGGFAFQIAGQQLNEDYSPRTKAKWESALNQLLNFELIQPLGYLGQIYQVTELGFQIADRLD